MVRTMILVSVIIPIYKVEPYIVSCIESVLNQTYRNLEVILIDDFSPDQSAKLATEFIKNSPKSIDLIFKYIKHDQNKGLSAARNSGINAATGDYIFFLDSDDKITEDCIWELVLNCEEGGVDVVCGGFKVVGNDNSLWYNRIFNDVYIIGNLEIIQYYLSGASYIMAWNKLVKRDVIKANKIYFIEGIIHEDIHWSFFLVNHIETMKCLSHIGYIYYNREGSIMNSIQVRRRYISYMEILSELDKSEKLGTIIPYLECLNYIDKLKVAWVRELCQTKEFEIREKIFFFLKIVKMHRSFSFLMRFCGCVIKGWGYRIIDKAVVLRSRLLDMSR